MDLSYSLDTKVNLWGAFLMGVGLDGRMDGDGINLESNAVSVLKMG